MHELKLINMEEIHAERVDFLWEPYIAQGKITLIQGDPGEGKTTMALAITAAVSYGGEIGDKGVSVIPGNVIFQTAEDGLADTIKPRLELLGAECKRIDVIDESENPLTLNDERIEAAINSTNAKLCIIDPIQGYLGGADMHSVNGIRPLMKSLAGVGERTGAAIILVGHLNKGGGKAAYRGLGSIDIIAAARSVLTVGRLSIDENIRAFVQTKSNFGPAGNPQAFGFNETSGFTWLGDCDVIVEDLLNGKKNKRPESQFAKARHLLETVLASGQPVASVEIMERAESEGISLKTLNRAKSELGIISIKIGERWFWQWPVDVVYETNQDTQDGHDSCASNMASLTIFKN
jgi:RecA-family ATPase